MKYLVLWVIAACGDDSSIAVDAAKSADAPTGCTLTANTTATSVTSTSGCAVLARDASSCKAARMAAGLSGAWLKFSCRVTLSVSGGTVTATTDNQPDYLSNYFATTDACHEAYTGAIQNPNTLAAQAYAIPFPQMPAGSPAQMRGAIVGLAVNGVAIFSNFAAPGDDIYQEAKTFDRCGGHPQNTGVYHYHSEPFAISDDDANLVGMLRDGVPLYGRRDADGTTPSDLDNDGGHTGTTPDSTTPVYHYHVNLQTSTATTSAGQQQWFLTTGLYHYAPSTCAACM